MPDVIYPDDYEVMFLASSSDADSLVDTGASFQSAVLERLDSLTVCAVLCVCFLFLIFYSMAKRR